MNELISNRSLEEEIIKLKKKKFTRQILGTVNVNTIH